LELSKSLTPLKQWYCDYCGDVIKSPEDGMLEWDNIELTASNYRIVHGKWIGSCRKARNQQNLSDNHLKHFLGSDGLMNLLTHFYRYNLKDELELIEIIKRLHIQYYEEGKVLLEANRELEPHLDPYGIGELYHHDLTYLIGRYK